MRTSLNRYCSLPFPFSRGWRFKHRASAVGRTAVTGVQLLPDGPAASRARQAIIIGQLNTRLDGLDSLNINVSVHDHCLTIRITGVIDKTRLIATVSSIDHNRFIDNKQKYVRV